MNFSELDREIRAFFVRWENENRSKLPLPGGSETPLLKGTAENPTTGFDLDLHGQLSSLLESISGLPVFSEEAASGDPSLSEHLLFWLIDPIDGTREFARAIPECVCSIALIDGSTGRPVYGSIHDIYGAKTFGTPGFRPEPPAQEPLSPRLLWSRGEAKLGLQGYLEALKPHFSEIRPHGSIAFKLLRCAQNPSQNAVISLQPKSKWDLAGAAAFVMNSPELALTDLLGNPLDFRGKLKDRVQGIVCARRELHSTLLEGLARSGATALKDLRTAAES